MSEPQVRLHDVSVAGDAELSDAVLAAIERAVAQVTATGQTSSDAVRSAVNASVAEVHQS